MALINKKKNYALNDLLIKAHNTFDVQSVQKILKNTTYKHLVDSMCMIESTKAIIFVLVACENYKPLKLILGLPYDIQKDIFVEATDAEMKIILRSLYADDLFELINLHREAAKRIYLNIDADKRLQIKKISSYDDDEIGHIMNPIFMSLNTQWTIRKAIKYIKQAIENIEYTNWIFVVDDNNKLVGYVRVFDLFFEKNTSSLISSIVKEDHTSVNAKFEIEDVINMFDKYSLEILAVVNNSNALVGFIRNSDIAAAMQDEATEDIYKMYGITELRTPYLHTSAWKIARSRLLWLSILMISATLTSAILEQFQTLSESLTSGISTIILIPLLPVLTGTSGNAGSQASASIIRSLSIGEITSKEYSKAMLKELRVGLLVGLSLAFINMLRLFVYYAIFNQTMLENIQESHRVMITWDQLYIRDIVVASASSLSLFISIVVAKFLGSALPILATKCNIDPTVMSAPILATLLDVITTTTLFGIGIFVVHSIFLGII